MSRENTIPPLTIKGSYAGAMGYPQFIASSYRHYAVDFNQDGKIDLFSDPIDAIGSIANYFDKHQWHDFGEIARPITLSNTHLKHATRSTSKPKQNAQYWRNKGLNIDSNIHNKTKLAFIRLPQQKIDDTWLTFWNFYVLTRYNHDNRYAMAAYQLSTKIRQQFNRNNH
jgi:membrane-bound lytic murein transglycosylase B